MSWIEGATGLVPLSFVIALAITLGAAVMRGLTGFGMAIILVPLLGMIMRSDDAVMLAIILQLLIGPLGLKTMITESDRRTAVPMAAIAILATPFGVWALAHTAPDVARVLIAGIAMAAFLLVLVPAKADYQPGMPLTLGAGSLAGFLTGFAAMPGPPVVPFYVRGGYDVVVARASMMLVFLATAIAAVASASLLGLISAQTVMLGALLFPAVLLGNWLGSLAFGRVSPLVWRSVIGVVLGVAGLSAVLRLFE